MRRAYTQTIVTLLLLLGSGYAAQAIPGYHINDDASARRAAREFADDSFKFRACVYQAQLDKSLWRLTLAAYDYLQQKKKNPERECSFASAYWQSQGVDVHEAVPPDKRKQLQGLQEETARCSKDAAEKLPGSVSAHLSYGQYLMYFVMGYEKVPLMLAEFKKAVVLQPEMGLTHYWLALGYFNSENNNSAITSNLVIKEATKAVEMDPRLTTSYFWISCAYWAKSDYKQDKIYLDKYLKFHPEAANRPDIVRAQEETQKKLAGGTK